MSELIEALRSAIAVAEQRGDRLALEGFETLDHEENMLSDAQSTYWAAVHRNTIPPAPSAVPSIVTKLKQYTRHFADCKINQWAHDGEPLHPCTCGLDDL